MGVSSDECIKVAVLGGPCTGKSSLVSRLAFNIIREAHYPTTKITGYPFVYRPRDPLARAILDEKAHGNYLQTDKRGGLEAIFSSPSINEYVLLSPLIFQSFIQEYNQIRSLGRSSQRSSGGKARYARSFEEHGISDSGKRCMGSFPEGYLPPSNYEIGIEITDVPCGNAEEVVLFRELSLFRQLDSGILRGLATQQGRLAKESFYLASSVAELNGKMDGYILVYSALPELGHADPPEYGVPADEGIEKQDSSSKDGGFSLLFELRHGLVEAQREFQQYHQDLLRPSDPDRISRAVGHPLDSSQLAETVTKLDACESMPPILIVCTHVMDPLRSPVLVEKGRKLALEWNCGFVGLDNMRNVNVEVAIACIVRDIIEREKLVHHGTKKKGVLKKVVGK